MDEMKPCPFCGGTEIFIEPDEAGSGGQWVAPIHVGCKKCQCEQMADDMADAITAWNTRHREDVGVVDAQDAARYRWLRDNCFINQYADRDFPHAVIMVQWFDGEHVCRMHPGHHPGVGIPGLDSAIDAAMSTQPAGDVGSEGA